MADNMDEIFKILRGVDHKTELCNNLVECIKGNVGKPYYGEQAVSHVYLSDEQISLLNTFSFRYVAFLVQETGRNYNLSNCSANDIGNYIKMDSVRNLLENLVREIFKKKGIEKYLNDHVQMKKDMTFSGFLTAHDNEIDKLKLLFMLYSYIPNNKMQAIEAIISKDYIYKNNKLDGYKSIPWNLDIVIEFGSSGKFYKNLKGPVCNKCEEKSKKIRQEKHVVATGRGNYVTRYENVEYEVIGEVVDTWIDQVKNSYELKPKSGCILAGTRILMADGSEKSIETLTCGDAVRNCEGGISYVSEELIINRNVDRLYGINDEECFLSLEHAVKTNRGWCCLDPQTAMDIDSHIMIHKLEIDDVICLLKPSNGKWIKKEITVKDIRIIDNKNQTICYDLHFYDGAHSYYANGIPCYLNYPQITSSYMKKQLMKMTKKERFEFITLIKNYSHLFNKVFGSWNIHYVLEHLHEEDNDYED